MQDKSAISTTWQSPSNLAIVKYWGKRDIQEPINPSVSFSLAKSTTRTKVSIIPKEGGGLSFRLNGEEKPDFHPKIQNLFDLIRSRIPFIDDYFIEIDSSNTFPHSSGIASSASAMSALAFCMADLHRKITETDHLEISEVSSLARLGSGSAARSVYGGWNLWGRMTEVPESSDHYAIPASVEIAPVFQNLHDDILIVNSSAKAVSSTAGHKLMNNHPYKEGRMNQAHNNTLKLLNHLKSGNLEGFTEIAETEALSLHGLMMSSSPSFTLLQPNTLLLIEKIKQFRRDTQIPVTFTLDAGPNIHLLYPDEFAKEVLEWENQELTAFCEQKTIIRDHVGKGPEKIIETK